MQNGETGIFQWIDLLPVAASVCAEGTMKIIKHNKLFTDLVGKKNLTLSEILGTSDVQDMVANTVYKMRLSDGSEKKLIVNSSLVEIDAEEYILSVYSDVSALRYKGAAVNLSGDDDDERIDKMTGIYNLRAGMEYLQEYISADSVSTICCLDIKGLKKVNDFMGLPSGDEYVLEVVEVVKSAIRMTDIFARMGGDEFMVIFPKCNMGVVENIMETIMNRFDFINKTSDRQYELAIHFGITELTPKTFKTGVEALNAALIKMKQNLAAAKNISG